MKGILLVSSIVLSALLVSCTDAPSTASLYKEKLASGEAYSDNSSPPPQTGNSLPDDAEEDGTDGANDENGDEPNAGGEGDTGGAGDPVAGAALLTGCKGCHNKDGSGSTVTLNAAAVDRLTAAYTGAKAGIHSGFKDAFVDGRDNLEAALKEVP